MYRTHEEWERDTKAAFEGVTAEQIQSEMDRLERKRNWTHADYTRMDSLANALSDLR
jgi:hypothetical protein